MKISRWYHHHSASFFSTQLFGPDPEDSYWWNSAVRAKNQANLTFFVGLNLSENNQNDIEYGWKWVEIGLPGLRICLSESQDHDESNKTPPDPKYSTQSAPNRPIGPWPNCLPFLRTMSTFPDTVLWFWAFWVGYWGTGGVSLDSSWSWDSNGRILSPGSQMSVHFKPNFIQLFVFSKVQANEKQ